MSSQAHKVTLPYDTNTLCEFLNSDRLQRSETEIVTLLLELLWHQLEVLRQHIDKHAIRSLSGMRFRYIDNPITSLSTSILLFNNNKCSLNILLWPVLSNSIKSLHFAYCHSHRSWIHGQKCCIFRLTRMWRLQFANYEQK